MNLRKMVKDRIRKYSIGYDIVPRGLFELHNYFSNYGSINFKYEVEDGLIVAVSTDFKFGSIITSGKNKQELDKNIKDAIFTSFGLPSAYAKEADVHNVPREGGRSNVYALARRSSSVNCKQYH